MYTKDFDRWIDVKKDLNKIDEDKLLYFHEREVWWCALGCNVGFEQDGKNDLFERPVLILRKFNKHFLLVIPQTTQRKEDRWYFYKTVNKGKDRWLLLTQMRTISSKRLLKKMYTIDKREFGDIRRRCKKLI